jgi:hypothetical protein
MLANIQLESFPAAWTEQVKSETETMFTDSIPANAAQLPYDRLIVELPCGVETEFERSGDGVRILWMRLTEELVGLTAVHDGA